MERVEFQNACTEVLEILKYVKENDLKKIPQSEIDNLKFNANKEYHFEYNPKKDIKEQGVSKLAKAIIAIFFTDYIATPKQKEIIKNKQRYDENIIENKKGELYLQNEIFNNNRSQYTNDNIENSALPRKIENKNFFRKLIDFIKEHIKNIQKKFT